LLTVQPPPLAFPAASTPRIRDVARIAVWAVGFRLLSAVLAFLENVAFPDRQPAPFTVGTAPNAFWDAFARWDSGWYFQIARNGPHFTPGGRDTIAWFPGYPLLMRAVGSLFGRRGFDVYLGGIVVSWTAFVLAAIGLYCLTRLDRSKHHAERTVLFVMVFPFSYFFGIVYSEALFLAATVWAFYFFRTRRWLLGGLLGAVATATRVNGIMMGPALAWIVWSDWAAMNVQQRVRALAGLVLVGAGIGTYSLYVYTLSGNPFEWAAAIQRWDYHPGGAPWLAPIRLIQTLLTQPYEYLTADPVAICDTLNGLSALAFLAAVPFIWRRFGAAYGLFMAANLWLPLSSGLFEGLGRYCSVMFPFFIWLGGVRARTAVVVAAGFATVYVLAQSLFTNIYPMF
jgi:hypothetical protein